MSSITKRAVVVDALPQESVAVNVTSLSPVAPHRSLKADVVVGPDHWAAASVGRLGTAVVGQPCCQLSRVSSSVALHRVVRRHNRDRWIGRVFDDERRRRRAAVVAIVR